MNGSWRQTEKGFTLLEVALAVAILGIGLTTLLGLQSNYLRSYAYEKSLVRAALIAQYIMAVMEADDDIPGPGDTEKDLYPALEKLGYFAENEKMSNQEVEYSQWQYHRVVTNVGIPPLENALKRINLDIIWGPAFNEKFSIVYFVSTLNLTEGGGESDGTDDSAEDDQTTGETSTDGITDGEGEEVVE